MTKSIEDLFVYLASGSDVLFLLFFIILFRKIKSNGLIALGVNCACALVLNYFIEFSEINDPLFYLIFTFLEYAFFSYFLYINIYNLKFKRFILVSSVLFTVFMIFYFAFANPKSLDSIPVGIETILVLIFSFFYLFEELNRSSPDVIYKKYQFPVVTGIMIYLAGSFFIYVYASQVSHDTIAQYWFLTNAFYVLKNLLFILSLFMSVKRSNIKPTSTELRPYLN
ncbi:MAG TPA: hypothetical protein VM843_00400 [Flavisolibacter sp.]|jgi:hypothetical protein|nr:hypothetical protein [Flavisolibacter sp.]